VGKVVDASAILSGRLILISQRPEWATVGPVIRSSALRDQDAQSLIAILAILEGHLAMDRDSSLSRHLGERLARDGAAASAANLDVRQAINDLNNRLRFALGETDTFVPHPVED
jgi:hypothetical protein